ncbi:MAG: T9SS type A sorting domain-containing protein [Ignavibacteriaceae bacterium]|jgi:hypothetical protein|nr:T9SS type A sorting domain-containing protein [Ignavibacteriaceae bacterium]
MKKILYLFIIILMVIVQYNYTIAQDGGVKMNGFTVPEIEKHYPSHKIVDVSEISQIDLELKQAIESGNKEQEDLLRMRFNEFYKDRISEQNPEERDYPLGASDGAFYQPEWLGNDVLVYSGDIGEVGSDHRRIDMKTGEDGNLYAAFIKRSETGLTGNIQIVKSTNGGGNWSNVSSITSTTRYFGQVSITVQNPYSNPDSTRILVFYSRSDNSDFNNAQIGFVSVRTDGANWTGGQAILSPSAGNKLLYPSAVSDGQYWSSATYFGVVCGEYSNDNTQGISLRLARTSNWGDSFVTTSIVDGYPTWGDWFPSADFKNEAVDSVYIAVERRFTSSKSQLRVIATPWAPSTGFNRYSISDVADEYKKPDLTIVQDDASLPKKIIVAYIRNGIANYSRSMDGGANWTLNSSLGLSEESNISYVSISSDSNATSSGYIVAAYQKMDSDSIVIRRGQPGSLGTRIHKVNEFKSSPYNAPVVAIYNQSGSKSSALLYTGLSTGNYTSNVYFDGEHLVTSVSELPGLARQYSLEQNYPNPFNPSTAIRFSIPEQTNVSLKIFNSIGQEVASLVNGELAAGNHEVNFNASKLSTGIYFYRIETPAFTSTKKMILIK